MDLPQSEETNEPEIVNLSKAQVENVRAGMVRAVQSSIKQMTSEEVDLQTSIAGNVKTSDLHASDSILGMVSTPQATVKGSTAGVIRADTINFDGIAGLAIADGFSGKDVNAIAVIGNKIEAASIKTGLLISNEIHGNVTTTLDGRTALMAALVAGSVAGLILLAGRLLFRRDD